MNKLQSHARNLNSTDVIVIIFCALLTLLNIIFSAKIETWYLNIAMNFGITAYIFYIAYKDNKVYNLFIRQLHYWYLVPLIFMFFKELYLMVDPIRGIIYDDILVEIDRFIFGADPTVELYKITNPYLTELLQIVYGTFFFLPVILGIDLILRDKSEEFHRAAFAIVYGFILSFIGYLIVPAIGPRFTLHNFETNNIEMPGLFLTNILREIVNSGESIPFGTQNPAAIVQRDAFPSGHTQITLLVMYLAVKFKSRFKYFFLINGTLLIFATVYLRYHYVIDLLGGIAFMIFTIWSGSYIFNWWQKKTNEGIAPGSR